MLPNKENLVFTGKWLTEDGTVVMVKDGIATILESKNTCMIRLNFPIDSLGKCSVSSAYDLKERIRDSEGYSR